MTPIISGARGKLWLDVCVSPTELYPPCTRGQRQPPIDGRRRRRRGSQRRQQHQQQQQQQPGALAGCQDARVTQSHDHLAARGWTDGHQPVQLRKCLFIEGPGGQWAQVCSRLTPPVTPPHCTRTGCWCDGGSLATASDSGTNSVCCAPAAEIAAPFARCPKGDLSARTREGDGHTDKQLVETERKGRKKSRRAADGQAPPPPSAN